MAKTIWKYRLPRDGATIQIHEYIVEVLHIAAQDGIPTLWAIVDPDRPRDGYTEVVAWGTGWPLPDDVYQETDYWGSCEDGCGYIWHYFAAARFSDLDSATTACEWRETSSYPLNTIATIPYTLTDSLSSSTEWAINQDTLAKLIEQIEGTCNTATNKCVQ